MKNKAIVLIAIIFCISKVIIAGHIAVSSSVFTGTDWRNNLGNNQTLFNLESNDPAFSTNAVGQYYQDYIVPENNTYAYLTLKVDLNNINQMHMPNRFMVKAIVRTDYYNGQSNTYRYDTLVVYYTNTYNIQFKDVGEAKFNIFYPTINTTFYATNITVLGYNDDGSTFTLTPNEILDSQNNYISWFLQTRIETDRYIDLAISQQSFTTESNYHPSDGCLYIHWNSIAEEYELEYMFIDSYGNNMNNLEFNFKENATRIRTKQTSFNFPLVNNLGFILYRVRGISRNRLDFNNNYERLYYTDWNIPDQGILGTYATPNINTYFYYIYENHNKNLNWQIVTTFAEDAKHSETVKYLDGTLRERQDVTRIQTGEKKEYYKTFGDITATDYLYDYVGRKAVSFLPTPIPNPILTYYPNLNVNQYNRLYSKDDFENFNPNSCNYENGGVISSSYPGSMAGAGKYYSSANWDIHDVNQFVIPDARTFPFSQTTYTKDNTNRIRAKTIPGGKLEIGNGHETKYFYGTPGQEELDRLFGNEVGYASHYKKNMVIDPNGQVTINYIDLKGNTIATGLTGMVPSNLEGINSPGAYNYLVDDLMEFNIKDTINNSLVCYKSILIPNEGLYNFVYTLDPEKLETINCQGDAVCYDCIYDFDILISSDNCPGEIAYQNTITIGQLFNGTTVSNTCNSTTTPFTLNLPQITLNQGSYTIRKELKVNNDALHLYLADLLKDTCDAWTRILEEEMSQVDSSGCNYVCGTCATQLEEFQLLEEPTQAEIEAIMNCFNQNSCDTMSSMCETFYETMVTDVSPFGQYGKVEFKITNTPTPFEGYVSNDDLSIYNTNNFLPGKNTDKQVCDLLGVNCYNNWLFPNIEFKDESNNIVMVPDEEGGSTTIQTVQPPEQSLTYYIDLFQEKWADQLVFLHPEYCYYQWCKLPNIEPLYISNLVMNNTFTYDSANAHNLLGYPTGDIQVGGNGVAFNHLVWAFLNQYTANGYDPQASNYFLPFYSLSPVPLQLINFGFINEYLKKVAVITTFCNPQDSYATIMNAITAHQFGYEAAFEDEEWLRFRGLYQSLKETWLSLDRTIYSIKNHCNNECIGNQQYEATITSLPPIFHGNLTPLISGPCDAAHFNYYKSKVRRFGSVSDVPPGNYKLTDILDTINHYPTNLETNLNIIADSINQFLDTLCTGCEGKTMTYGYATDQEWKDFLQKMIVNDHLLSYPPPAAAWSTYDVSFLSTTSTIRTRYDDNLKLFHGSLTQIFNQPYFIRNSSTTSNCFYCDWTPYCGSCCSDQLFMYENGVEQNHQFILDWKNIISIDNVYEIPVLDAEVFLHYAINNDIRKNSSDFSFYRVNATYNGTYNGTNYVFPIILDLVISNTKGCDQPFICDECIVTECPVESNPSIPTNDFKGLMQFLVNGSYLTSTNNLFIPTTNTTLPNSVKNAYSLLTTTQAPNSQTTVIIYESTDPIKYCSSIRISRPSSVVNWGDINSILSFSPTTQNYFAIDPPDQSDINEKGIYNYYQLIVQLNNGSIARIEVCRHKACDCQQITKICDADTITLHSFDEKYNKTLIICNCDPCQPIKTFKIDLDNHCARELISNAHHNAEVRYQAYKDSLAEVFKRNYIKKCLSALEEFTVEYFDMTNHFTLYYYDQANNLVQTIPPNGLDHTLLDQHSTTTDGIFAQIKHYRQTSSGTPWIPTHTMASKYNFNSLNQVIEQRTPDAGITRFVYDENRRLIRSQNAGQLLINAYTYTLFDNLNRIIETGQMEFSTPNAFTHYLIYSTHHNEVESNVRKSQITRTYYDEAPSWILPSLATNWQKNLRGRVSNRYYQSTIFSDSHSDALTMIDAASHYSYDISGNVNTLVQELPFMNNNQATTNTTKRIDYDYDIISGKVNAMYYQKNCWDQFIYKYDYDDQNRIRNAFSSCDGSSWDNDASYFYHHYGPLARTEFGSSKVQGMDFVYTIQGWLKGINSTSLRDKTDVGGDGVNIPNNPNKTVACDALGFMIGYFENDYSPISTVNSNTTINIPFDQLNSWIIGTNQDLYNGNIAQILSNQAVPITNQQNQIINKYDNALLYSYKYDQLQRLIHQDVFEVDANMLEDPDIYPTDNYMVNLSYDPVGNIIGLSRNGNQDNNPLAMDNLQYNYYTYTNKLEKIVEDQNILNTDYSNDIDSYAGQSDNYLYDANGNLLQDLSEEITTIEWSIANKPTYLQKGFNDAMNLNFFYDANGNRITKIKNEQEVKECYVRDAQGNIIAVYKLTTEGETPDTALYLENVYLYGSSRLGQWNPHSKFTKYFGEKLSHFKNQRNYELTNHLGNVMVTISDHKQGRDPNQNMVVDYYEPTIVNSQDYYPGGMLMPGRCHPDPVINTKPYRFGFNGKENDNEIKGTGNSLDFGARIYDPRVVRWLSVDPSRQKYPYLSPYIAFDNNPIFFNDPDGEDAEFTISGNTITFSAKIVIIGDGATAAKAQEMQRQIMGKFSDGGTYKAPDGNVYNVKFDIAVTVAKNAGKVNAGTNLVRLRNVDPSKRSWVKGWYGKWNLNNKDAYPHETGHFVGLDDRYKEYKHDQSNLPGDKDDSYVENTGNTPIEDFMGKNASNPKVNTEMTQQEVDKLAEYALKNQKNGKGVIKTGAVNTPTKNEVAAGKKRSEDKVVEPDPNSLVK